VSGERAVDAYWRARAQALSAAAKACREAAAAKFDRVTVEFLHTLAASYEAQSRVALEQTARADADAALATADRATND
jgi:hypothetical protein